MRAATNKTLCNCEYEASFLGSCIKNNQFIKENLELDPAVFTSDLYADIWAYLTARYLSPKDTGRVGTELMLANHPNVAGQKHAENIVGDLIKKAVKGGDDVYKMAENLRNLVSARNVYNSLQHGMESIARNSSPDVVSIAKEKVLRELAESAVLEAPKDLDYYIREVIDDISSGTSWRDSGISTGFKDLDKLTYGLQQGFLIIAAGRPGMGKTAFAINMACNVGRELRKQNKSVAFFSLEMSSKQIAQRVFSKHTNIPLCDIISGKACSNNESILEAANKLIDEHNMYITDNASFSRLPVLCGKIRQLHQRFNLGCVFIDYLQLIGNGKQSNSRVFEIGEITRTLKLLARNLMVPIVVLSQLSRSVETREDKLPNLSDLRDSGTIEQDADVVMFLFREAYYLKQICVDKNEKQREFVEKRLKAVQNIAHIIVSKNRQGGDGTVVLHCSLEHMLFRDRIR